MQMHIATELWILIINWKGVALNTSLFSQARIWVRITAPSKTV